MSESFAAKLTLVLKVLSMSRARLAAELNLDKSVVTRWASGATTPSDHNLSSLSALLARSAPGFTALDWDRDMDSLASLFGANRAPAPQAPAPMAGLTLPFFDQILTRTALRGKAYEGFYRSTRPYATQPGRFIHDHLRVRLGADGLLQFKMSTGGVVAAGQVLPVHDQLFVIGTEFSGGTLVFVILHGVNGLKAEVLDGITLTCNLDTGRTPASTPVVYHRVGDLTGDPAEDDARLDALAAPDPVAPVGSIPDDLQRHLARDVGPAAWAAGGDWALRLPLARALSRGPNALLP